MAHRGGRPAGPTATVGFAGLGRMGWPMAANLAEAGFPLMLWNRNEEKSEALAASTGATVAETPGQLAGSCDVVVTMLSDDTASHEVHFSADGLLSNTPRATHIISMGTHSPAHIRQLAERSAPTTIIDAPVSGSVVAATERRLLIMAGATEEAVQPIRPVLDAMGHDTICLGAVGSGATMKLVVNMLIHGLNQTVAEALLLAESSGIAVADAYHTIENSAAAAPMLHYRKNNYLDETASPVAFALSLARKDLELALDLADEQGLTLAQTDRNLDELRAAEAAGFGDRDMAALLNHLRSRD